MAAINNPAVAGDVTRAGADLLATTLDNYRGKLVDNVFNKHVLSWMLMEKNRTRMESGGLNIVEHLMFEENDDVTQYDEWDTVDITPQGGIDTASYEWKALVSTIAMSGMEEFKNQGKEQIINLLKARIMQSEKSLQKMVNNQLWGIDTTGFNSILDLIDDTATVGGINPATQTKWASPVTDLSAADTGNTTDPGTFAEFQRTATNLYNTASDGNDQVKALIGDQGSHEIYELGLTPNVRFTDTKAASIGFQNVAFKGVPFYWDKAAPVGTVIGINPETISLVGGKGRWFKQSGFTKSPIDGDGGALGGGTFRDARYAVITAFGNLTTNERRKNFKIVNFAQA